MINKLLEPFPKKVGSFVKDTWDVLRKLPKSVKPGSEIVSLDVKDLYTNIDNNLGLKAIEYYMDKFPQLVHRRLGKEFVLNALKMMQENILFELNGTVFQQLNGCAMGKDYGPSWATTSLGFLEETQLYPKIRTTFPAEVAESIIEQYIRFQDDTQLFNEFNINTLELLDIFNGLHPALSFTIESSAEMLPFLDILLGVDSSGNIVTKIYNKNTDSFNYLHFTSNHPAHIKRNIPYCLARRIKGIVMKAVDRADSYRLLFNRLRAKGYPSKLVLDAIKRAEDIPRAEIIAEYSKKSQETPDKVTLITTHQPVLDKIGAEVVKFVRETKLPCLESKKLIHGKRQPPNLNRQLTRTNTFSKTLNRVTACMRKNCGLCSLGHDNLIQGDSYRLKSGKILRPNRSITCETGNLVYCIICPGCDQYYIGECKCLRKRMNLHRHDSNPKNAVPPLKVNQHIRKCSNGYFRVFPFYVVPTEHQIAREGYETHFQQTLEPSLH